MTKRLYNLRMGRYGAGTLFQRGKKGIWYYQAYVGGKQVGPLSSKSSDRRDAERELDKLLGKRARNELSFTSRSITVATVLRSYLEHVRETRESSTAREYRCHIENELVPAFGTLKPERLSTDHLRKYREKRRAESALKCIRTRAGVKKLPMSHRTVSDSTINRELSVLRAAMNHAVKTGDGVSFPIPHFPMVREKTIRKGFLNEDAFEKQFWALPYWGVRALAAVSFYTGIRRGELTKIDWPQIDFRAMVITIYETKNHDAREVPILSGLMERSLREAKREHDQCWPECPAVFAYRGKRLGNPKRSWGKVAKKMRLASTRMHDLRRSANRNLRDLGVPQPIRMSIMGHRTPSMDRRYGIVDRTDLDVVRELHARKQAAKTTAKTTATGTDDC
jgi:integrase